MIPTARPSPSMPMRTSQIAALTLLCLLIVACSASVVREGGARQPQRAVSAPKYGASVVVQRGDTLYRIATNHRISPLDLAMWNNVPPPYTIYPGQRLRLYPGGTRVAVGASTAVRPAQPRPAPSSSSTPPSSMPPRTVPRPLPPAAAAVAPASSNIAWRWPAEGQLVGRYVAGEPTKQGIDIAGVGGSPVRAAGDGVVVYSGSGLIGYGELIIIKHNAEFLSAYGYNRKRLVAEGDRVRAGQAIAEMGRSPAAVDALHFEIRRGGKPVDPSRYLPRR